jgi:hypothetical protein
MKREYELVNYDCQDGECLMIHEKTTDSKLGALSLNHRSIGEAIVDELNMLSEKLYVEECRTPTFVLTTHISDEDWERFKELFRIYCDNGDVDD